MSASDFFNRWSKRKGEVANANLPAPDAAVDVSATVEPGLVPKPLPTIADLDKLTPDSDYSAFLANGVDENVKRSALKKLFADPHFNVMDGLDTYIDDYSKPDPIPAAMLAALNHAKDLLDPLRVIGSQDASTKTLMALADPEPPVEQGRQIAQAGLPPAAADGKKDPDEDSDAAPPSSNSDTQPSDDTA